MLASITPLGERGRGRRWGITVAAHLVGAGLSGGVGAGAAIGATFGSVRGATILAGARVTRPQQLVRVDEILRRWNVRSLVATLVVQSGISAALVAGAIR